ncbi:alpha-L-fucosidase [Paenibacillus alginolyticus]|uniref:alpha-L-fucosidase n=1 Tax=Paenibacillus alginolyticus TaxID=59839 RepID=UPI0004185DD5|nr:alpha-L-fucosidase [Paenibacillus alginolyticus]MCY9670325.1 alpha-L-fucosidase [Paenibacillus alginolyticus]
MNTFIKNAAQIVPSVRQLAWQELEFYSFIHFGINTFTDKEWGLGDEDPALFNPTTYNAQQWVEVCKSAGMNGLILTCKHHDGFCLWPSAYTEYSVKNSPWQGGNGDIVKAVSDACREGGIRFGVYLSPWDRHDQRYGSSLYNDYFKNQLRELLTHYGDIFCVWFDGACGEGPNGLKQVYDWDGYYQVIRELQPNAMISVCGPDVRWCGNEAGHTRESEWSVVPEELQDCEKIQEESQHVDDGEFSRRINSREENLGSREAIRGKDKLIWYPAEVNTSIRPGWFYHAAEDDKVRSVEDLLNIYYKSVGGNSTFLLNLPPDRRGLIHENDAMRMAELGRILTSTFRHNLASGAHATATETMNENHDVNRIFDGNKNTYWCQREGMEHAVIEIDLNLERMFDTIVLKEHIQSGQRIEKLRIDYLHQGKWKFLCECTVVGYKRICQFPEVTARYVRLTIEESRWCPTLSAFEVYLSERNFAKLVTE